MIEAENAVLTDGAKPKEHYTFNNGKPGVEHTTVTGGTITFNNTHIPAPAQAGFYTITIEYIDPGTYTHPIIGKNNDTPRPLDFPGTKENKGKMTTTTTTLHLDKTTRKLTINTKNTPLHINKITINPTPNQRAAPRRSQTGQNPARHPGEQPRLESRNCNALNPLHKLQTRDCPMDIAWLGPETRGNRGGVIEA